MRNVPILDTCRAPLRTALAACFIALAGCNPQAMLDSLAPKEETAAAKYAVALLAARDFDTFEAQAEPSLRTPETRARLKEIADLIPPGEPLSVHVVGANTIYASGTARYDLSFEYAYPGKWILVNVVLRRQDTRLEIRGLHVKPLPKPLAELNSFSLTGKGVRNYLMLTLILIITLFILFSLVLCIRTKMARRKWLWIIFILVGVSALSMNWSTGAMGFSLFHVSLFGASAMRQGLVGPWILSVSIPIGAIIFLLRRRALMTPEPPPPTTSVE